jgi:hypothetical protein
MFVDTDIHILKRIEQDSRHPNVVGEFCLVCHPADEQTLTIYFVFNKVYSLIHSAKVVKNQGLGKFF